MHTAQLLSQAIDLSRRAGYQIREEVLEGAGGGHYLIHGKKCLMLDLTQTHQEQLKDVLDALQAEPHLDLTDVSEPLVQYLRVPRAA